MVFLSGAFPSPAVYGDLSGVYGPAWILIKPELLLSPIKA